MNVGNDTPAGHAVEGNPCLPDPSPLQVDLVTLLSQYLASPGPVLTNHSKVENVLAHNRSLRETNSGLAEVVILALKQIEDQGVAQQ
jgi:hypothetical protein